MIARYLSLSGILMALGCSASPPVAPEAATSAASASAPIAAVTVAPPPPAPAVTTIASAAPEPSTAPSAAPAAEPVPDVKVANIGMHIGGGPNDAATKEPIKKSVAPHFDDLKRCYAKVEEKKNGDFGVDFLIDKDGGKPLKISHVKTTLHGEAFKSCMLSTYEGIEFLKPKGGKTTVSYSVRFTP